MCTPKPTVGIWNFADSRKCRSHLASHVLTPEESHGWYLVWNEEYSALRPTKDAIDECFELRKKLELIHDTSDLPPIVSELIRRYIESIQRADVDGRKLGWHLSGHSQTIGLGIDGIFYVTREQQEGIGFNTVIVTGFIPGLGSAQAVRASQSRPSDMHARDVGVSRMRRDHATRHQSTYSFVNRLQEAIAHQWNFEQKLYYLVFRPAVQHIRGAQVWQDRPERNLAELKQVLPKMSQLKFEQWNTLRMRVRGSHE